MSMIRTRWAAVGAAVAVTLGAGGLTFVDAAKSSGDRPVTVTLDEPCRMVDTRPDKGIGGRTTPIGEGEEHTVTATGTSGNCTIPTDAIGLVGNATAVSASENTNLRFYPADASGYPQVSNLNPRPGAPPTPNAVTVGLSSSDQFKIRNAKGTVHVIFDVAAYLVHHTHKEYDSHAAYDVVDNSSEAIASSDKVVLSATVDTPTSGYVIANASIQGQGSLASTFVRCSARPFVPDPAEIDFDNLMIEELPAGEQGTLSLTRTFVENKGAPVIWDDNEMTVSIVCDTANGQFLLNDASLSVVFVPDQDAYKRLISTS
jgi:hypothetical protein